MNRFQCNLVKYGPHTCIEAYRLNREQGEGPSNIGQMLGLTTGQANAAIDAGHWFIKVRDVDNSDAGLPEFNHNLLR